MTASNVHNNVAGCQRSIYLSMLAGDYNNQLIITDISKERNMHTNNVQSACAAQASYSTVYYL